MEKKELYKLLNILFDDDELTSDCCGAYTTETEMGICPECLEHCEFE
jgi:hypothetical protein|tara:strand:- start:250 stop:390 length:141 start_codon:yes stop_codon:yes gene_type:complete